MQDLLHGVPPFVAERIRRINQKPVRPGGAFVLYWMRTAARGHENPALDAAIGIANQLGLPVLVYHALSERYPYASDRHHRFILEGARDASREVSARGVRYAFHLERPGHRGPHLRTLAHEAAVVLTEEMPVAPLQQWTDRLARDAPVAVCCVDTACVVPMQRVGRAFTRAFRFREATKALRAARLTHSWSELQPAVPAPSVVLPFEPVALQEADLSALIAACDIDHSVGPVPHTQGGASAGYRRWSRFAQGSLRAYARLRNNALRDGVSRMSAYLHYGHVSPFRIARACARDGGPGAKKFLDELLIWRELSYSWCFYEPDHDSLDALPDWARQTLEHRADDPRPSLPTAEALERGQVGEPLWDAAQASLRIHGELHNNVRMTWGKALLAWTPGPQEALKQLIDLNHRFALDGRDPCSYGGLLWCMGQFDRPFSPPQPIYGAVRARDPAVHAQRLSPSAYGRHTGRPLLDPPPRTAVVGGGLAGVFCARILRDHAYPAVLFGPMASGAPQEARLDRPPIDRLSASWRFLGWITGTEGAYIVDPLRLAAALAPAWPRPVPSRVERTPKGWRLWDEDGDSSGPYDALVVSDPQVARAVGVTEGADVFICPDGGIQDQLLAGSAAAGRVLNRYTDLHTQSPEQVGLFEPGAHSPA